MSLYNIFTDSKQMFALTGESPIHLSHACMHEPSVQRAVFSSSTRVHSHDAEATSAATPDIDDGSVCKASILPTISQNLLPLGSP